MESSLKKITSYFLVLIILMFTVIGILGIWDLIDLDFILQKIFQTLIVIFCSTALILFVFSVLLKEKDNNQN